MRTSLIFSLGVAIFTMLFGAGNIIFPLAIGRDVGDKVGFAMVGFFLTAIIVPLLGLVATMLFDGDYRRFFGSLGSLPGFLCGLLCMVLIGPFGATPRCVTLSYAALCWYIPQCSLFVFSLIAVVVIFALTVHKGRLMMIFGQILGPLKLVLLLSIMVFAFISSRSIAPGVFAPWHSFFKGLKEGYFTMDLLGTIFFASLVYGAICSNLKKATLVNSRVIAKIGLKAGLVGAGLLGVVYLGFCLAAALHSPNLVDVPKEQLLSTMACLVLGDRVGIIANITVAIACLTAAMALTTIFADYISKELFGGRLSYTKALLATVIIVFAVSNVGFTGIMIFIEPVAGVFYPMLVVLAIANIAKKLVGFRWTKPTVYTTFFVTICFYMRHLFNVFFN